MTKIEAKTWRRWELAPRARAEGARRLDSRGRAAGVKKLSEPSTRRAIASLVRRRPPATRFLSSYGCVAPPLFAPAGWLMPAP